MLNALQAGADSTLSQTLGQPFPVALIIVTASATSLLIAGILSGEFVWPDGDKWEGRPWWAWIGDMMGATFVMSQLLVAERSVQRRISGSR